MTRQPQGVFCMGTNQSGLTMIQIVGTLAEVEIQDIDTDHLLHVLIILTYLHVLSDGFSHTVEHTLQIV